MTEKTSGWVEFCVTPAKLCWSLLIKVFICSYLKWLSYCLYKYIFLLWKFHIFDINTTKFEKKRYFRILCILYNTSDCWIFIFSQLIHHSGTWICLLTFFFFNLKQYILCSLKRIYWYFSAISNKNTIIFSLALYYLPI